MALGSGAVVCAFFSFFYLVTSASLNLDEGEICNREGDKIWRCQSIKSCPKAESDLIINKKRPILCNFKGRHPVVCCEHATAGVKSKQMCRKYAESVIMKIPSEVGKDEWTYDTCAAAVEPLILGGMDATPREYPHMALIGYGDEDDKRWLCGGSLISERFILSAAHCSNISQGVARWARLGEHNMKSTMDDEKGMSCPTDYEIIERINHPNYKAPSLYHDIALYRLAKDVDINEYVRPICLQTEPEIHKDYAIATGWGRTSYGGRVSDVLQKVNVTLTANSKCRDHYKDSVKQLKFGVTSNSMFCAGDPEDGKDSCQGDSGGPLQLRLRDPYCMYTQIGITSFGDVCGFKPGVYTRVSNYVEWIESKVWP